MKTVVFDCMGTLVELLPPGPRLRAELHRRASLEVTEARAAAAFDEEIRYYVAHHQEGHDAAALAELRDRCADVLRRSLDLDRNALPAVRAAMFASLEFRPFPDAAAALVAVRERGLGAVVASNWDCSLPQVLQEARLLDLVDGVVSSAAVGAAKPDARLFEAALDAGRCTAEQAVLVGDSLEIDVGGARAAGIRPVLLRRSADAPAAHGVTTIRSLEELPAVI